MRTARAHKRGFREEAPARTFYAASHRYGPRRYRQSRRADERRYWLPPRVHTLATNRLIRFR